MCCLGLATMWTRRAGPLLLAPSSMVAVYATATRVRSEAGPGAPVDSCFDARVSSWIEDPRHVLRFGSFLTEQLGSLNPGPPRGLGTRSSGELSAAALTLRSCARAGTRTGAYILFRRRRRVAAPLWPYESRMVGRGGRPRLRVCYVLF